MGSKLIDMTGQTFGRLTVEERDGTRTTPNGTRQTLWRCRCQCGGTTTATAADLRRKDGKAIKSCRACSGTTHGHTARGAISPTYRTWHSMISRCQRDPAYVAAGIKVCPHWETFANFLADMGERPSLRHTIDRRDGTRGYEPGNCRWATRAEQSRNMRTNLRITLDGRTMILADWLRTIGLSWWAFNDRRKKGLTPEQALTWPKGKKIP